MRGNIDGLETQHQAIRSAYQSMTSKIKLDVSLHRNLPNSNVPYHRRRLINF